MQEVRVVLPDGCNSGRIGEKLLRIDYIGR